MPEIKVSSDSQHPLQIYIILKHITNAKKLAFSISFALTESVFCVDNTAAPVFEQTLAKVTSKAGATVKLACVVSGAPQPEIRWYHGNNLLHDNSRHSQRLMGKDASLLIRDVEVEDAGGYRCVATNSLGEVSCSTILKVEGNLSYNSVFEILNEQSLEQMKCTRMLPGKG